MRKSILVRAKRSNGVRGRQGRRRSVGEVQCVRNKGTLGLVWAVLADMLLCRMNSRSVGLILGVGLPGIVFMLAHSGMLIFTHFQ
jgi:hypothetical protein